MFAILVVLSNLVSQKFIHIDFFGLYHTELSAGTLLYPFTFVLVDLLAEFYGRDMARFCVRSAIIINIIVASLMLFLDQLPATAWSKVSQAEFHHTLGHYSFMLIGSLTATYIAQRLDIYLYLKLRQLTNGRGLWLRSNLSTLISLIVDSSIILCFMALSGGLPYGHIAPLIASTSVFKLLFSVISTPLFYLGSYLIKLGQHPEELKFIHK